MFVLRTAKVTPSVFTQASLPATATKPTPNSLQDFCWLAGRRAFRRGAAATIVVRWVPEYLRCVVRDGEAHKQLASRSNHSRAAACSAALTSAALRNVITATLLERA